ncbi:UBX domain-containing protein 6-like isoform X1 [Stylophora pistillata]|uniref:UBX domain-containing protein 6 n=1 Tax=Stylophora pistillata TaxID=50429 RepID=A0A2B4SL16_STYPI|nr:UBX domain-containing protein 6-like isoform X1 [Stylophora pistillata]XP_022784083.1 UBX domain-containing protein 6-like isoform X1 [Stylophora pistillata]PFX29570.1 UBX domain-containing protein 6 [Stylophora pistillata]
MKKLLEKANLDYKFKKAGEGHALTGNSSTASQQQATSSAPAVPRAAPSSDAQRAGQAALERFSVHEKSAVKKPKSATATWKHSGPAETSQSSSGTGAALKLNQLKREVRQELAYQEACKQRDVQREVQSTAEPTHVECSTVLSQEGVYFICPVCPVTVLKNELDTHLWECLSKQYPGEPLTTSCSMIHTLNKDKEKVKACIDLICRYLDNICKNPEEEKYRKIKQSNKIFQERVVPIKGATEFLLACGFEDKVLLVEADSEEKFFVLPKDECCDCERLNVYKEVLTSTQALKAKLDRCLKVYKPSSQASHFEVPWDFYNKTAEEVKSEQIARTEEVERNSQLRTRAMREAEKRPSKTYRFTLVRIRFPDGVILQGTFYSRENLGDVFEFVRQSLVSEWQPFLIFEAGRQLKDEKATLVDLGLVPAALVNFKWDPVIMKEIAAAQGQVDENIFLKPEVLCRVQELS